MAWLHISMSWFWTFSNYKASTAAIFWRKALVWKIKLCYITKKNPKCSVYVRNYPHSFFMWLLFFKTNISYLIGAYLPKVDKHCDIFQSTIRDCGSTEWNAPWTNTEVGDNVEAQRGGFRLRGSSQPGSVFKHWGHFKGSSLPTTQSLTFQQKSPPSLSLSLAVDLWAWDKEE